ncbi:MAG: phospholipase A [Ramlibacter sp.]|nr:phospholipase A [Ramlibacter sp.]
MATLQRQPGTQLRAAQAAGLALAACGALAASPALAQAQPPADAGWQACVATADSATRLACFDRWAQQQPRPSLAGAERAPGVPAASALGQDNSTAAQAQLPATRVISITSEQGCHDHQYSALSRFWELESGTDCGTFGIRGYRPISVSLIAADNINTQPTSANPDNNALTPQDYRKTETRIQLSIRTKLAQGLLTGNHPTLKDSLWFGYTQQSYWQLFNGGISRPFRSTDHEPELVYVYPTELALPAGWRLRYTGAGLSHQSNGQSLPLSRSWNRAYLMAGMEKDRRARVEAKVWQRMPESGGNDNPDISDYVGRAEVAAFWELDRQNTLGATLRNSLRARPRGSLRLEWLRALGAGAPGGAPNDLRLHLQWFSGYGDSLLDYNHRRNVFSVGLSLVDW